MGRSTLDQIGVLGLYTETPLHCGAESGTGYVDQPIQRERHTGFPVIPGSTLKGVLRDEVKASLGRQGKPADEIARRLRSVFGSEDGDNPFPGQVSFGDGILAAFPVRSSGVPFHWVTCPFVVERLFRLLGQEVEVEEPEKGTCWGRTAGDVLLEEIRLRKESRDAFFGETAPGLTAFLSLLPSEQRGFGYTRTVLPDRLLVLSDDDFRELTETGTEVLTRIKLNALGTTATLDDKDPEFAHLSDWERQGNMFVQEVVPPETLFVSSLRAAAAESAFGGELDDLHVLRVGGDETVGRGVTHLTFVATGEDER